MTTTPTADPTEAEQEMAMREVVRAVAAKHQLARHAEPLAELLIEVRRNGGGGIDVMLGNLLGDIEETLNRRLLAAWPEWFTRGWPRPRP